MHGRSHTRSPGVSIMRVDSRELPLSAIPLCQLLPFYLLGSKRKLHVPRPACQFQLGLPSAICRLRGVQFPGTMYICNLGPLSSHCISCVPSACSHCRRCCCCPLQCDRWCMVTCRNSAGGAGPYHRS